VSLTESLGPILKAAVLAGLLAGAAAAGFHSLLIEPVTDRAVEREKRINPSRAEAPKEPLVSRSTQRWGLIVGLLLYGAIWGLLFGAVFHLTRGWHPAAWTVTKRGMLLAVLAGWSVAVFPFLKYPANPPGVGDPETIGYRQGLYFGFIALSIAGTVLAGALHRLLTLRAQMSGNGRAHRPLALVVYTIYAAGVYVAMPANPDPVRMPAELVWTFRVISLAGLILFWGVLGGTFGWLFQARAHPVLERPRI